MKTNLVKSLKSILRFLNTIFRFIFGQDAVYVRNLVHGHANEILKGAMLYVGISIAIPVVSIIVAFILGSIFSLDATAHSIMAIGFLIASISWIILSLGMSGFLKLLSIITIPTELFEETVDLHYNSENVGNFLKNCFNALTWIIVATLYCSIIPVWNSLSAFILLLVIVLFLIISMPGWGFKPDIKVYKTIWKIVFVLFIITTLRFLPDSFWVKTTGHVPPRWFGFNYSETQKTIKKAEKLLAKANDKVTNENLKPHLISLENGLKHDINADELRLLIRRTQTSTDSAKKIRNQESLPKMAWRASEKIYKKVSNSWPFGNNSNDSKKDKKDKNKIQLDLSAGWSTHRHIIPISKERMIITGISEERLRQIRIQLGCGSSFNLAIGAYHDETVGIFNFDNGNRYGSCISIYSFSCVIHKNNKGDSNIRIAFFYFLIFYLIKPQPH